MEYLETLADMILHLDVYLAQMITTYKNWIYAILFLVVFLETGILVASILPGDSLLFVTGALAALPSNHLNVHLISILFILAAICGGWANYITGRRFGEKLILKPNSKFIKKKHLAETKRFFEKYGGKTIVLARFIPFVRTFAPFVAGLGKMNYHNFSAYNIIGAIIWVLSIVYFGYFLGAIPTVQDNIQWFIFAIIIIVNAPAVFGILKRYYQKRHD